MHPGVPVCILTLRPHLPKESEEAKLTLQFGEKPRKPKDSPEEFVTMNRDSPILSGVLHGPLISIKVKSLTKSGYL